MVGIDYDSASASVNPEKFHSWQILSRKAKKIEREEPYAQASDSR